MGRIQRRLAQAPSAAAEVRPVRTTRVLRRVRRRTPPRRKRRQLRARARPPRQPWRRQVPLRGVISPSWVHEIHRRRSQPPFRSEVLLLRTRSSWKHHRGGTRTGLRPEVANLTRARRGLLSAAPGHMTVPDESSAPSAPEADRGCAGLASAYSEMVSAGADIDRN